VPLQSLCCGAQHTSTLGITNVAVSSAGEFQQSLGAEVAAILGPRYKFFRSRNELRSEIPGGHHVVVITGSNKWSPDVEVAFYFGKNFSAAKDIEKRLGIFQFYYHVQQYSPNCAFANLGPYSGPCSWSVNITKPPPGLAWEIAQAIEGLSKPFLEKYDSLVAARDAIAGDDPNVFGGPPFWAQLLRLDLALDDLLHFERWAEKLEELPRTQAQAVIQVYRQRSR